MSKCERERLLQNVGEPCKVVRVQLLDDWFVALAREGRVFNALQRALDVGLRSALISVLLSFT